MGNKCCICGRSINILNTYHWSFQEHSIETCMFCIEALEQVESGNPTKVESGAKHLLSELKRGMATPEVTLMVQEVLDDISDEELKDTLANTPVSHEHYSYTINSQLPALVGIALIILGVFLYYASVNNQYGIANIPCTIFSAASFVGAIVCFATSSILKAIKRK